jgi:hypothetical protein
LLLQYTKDEGLESIARMCVRNIIQYHWNRKEGFAYECLDNLYKPYSNNYLSRTSDKPNYGPEFISGWHSIQGAFKVMLEALRVQSLEMFEDGLEFGYQVFDTHWKESEPCGFDDYQNVEDLRQRRGIRSIADYAIYDFLVFSLLALEHTLSARAVGCFEKAYLCALSKPEGIYTGSLTLHEPRGVMFCLEILDRIAGRNGRASGFLGSERKFEEST